MSAAREQLAALLQECPYIGANAVPARVEEWYGHAAQWLNEHGITAGVSLLRAPQSGPWTWDTAPAALKQIRADAMRLGKAGERIVLLVDTLVPRVQHVNAAGSGAETPPQPEIP